VTRRLADRDLAAALVRVEPRPVRDFVPPARERLVVAFRLVPVRLDELFRLVPERLVPDFVRDLAVPDLVVRALVVRAFVPDFVVRAFVVRAFVVRDFAVPDLVVRALVVRPLVVPDFVVRDLVVRDFAVPDFAVRDFAVPDLVVRALVVRDFAVPDFVVRALVVPDFAPEREVVLRVVPDLRAVPALRAVPDFVVRDLAVPDFVVRDFVVRDLVVLERLDPPVVRAATFLGRSSAFISIEPTGPTGYSNMRLLLVVALRGRLLHARSLFRPRPRPPLSLLPRHGTLELLFVHLRAPADAEPLCLTVELLARLAAVRARARGRPGARARGTRTGARGARPRA
jgi:hypothetical protein